MFYYLQITSLFIKHKQINTIILKYKKSALRIQKMYLTILFGLLGKVSPKKSYLSLVKRSSVGEEMIV